MGYLSQLLRKCVAHVLKVEEEDCIGKQELKKKDIAEIQGIVKRVANHPVWTHAYSTGPMKAVEEALLKNQNADKAFKKVGLNIGYALTGDLESEWAG